MIHKCNLIVIALVFLFCGCSGQVPLTGKVTFADNGSPLTTGTVCFVNGAFLARGNLKPDGTYEVSSTGNNDGLPKGKYKVYLVGAELVQSDGGNSSYTPLVDRRYESAATTDIECSIDGSTRQFDFQVERFRQGRR